jgi:acetyltransferase
MTIPGKKFDPERAFRPETIALSGAATAIGQKILANLHAANREPAATTADLAIVADDAPNVPAAIAAHAAQGTRAAIVLSNAADLGALVRAHNIRILGPHSYGMVLPGLNLSTLPDIPPPGRVALVGQSAALARSVIDWAIPNAIGFSQIIGIGGNADIGFGLVLDHLSRDPHTNAIMVEIDRLRDPRLFHTAARAAARLRPVIALAPGLRLRDASGTARAGVEAALSRAGVLLTETIGEFLAAAETLTRVKPVRGETLAIIANSAAAGRLAADSALAQTIPLATLRPETAQIIALALGTTPPATGPIAIRGAATKLAELAALLSPAPEIGGILIVHTPTGADDGLAMEALVACAKTIKIPLLIAVLGDATGAAHRHRLAQAGLASFETPEAAIAGFRHLIRNRRNRAAARELPAAQVLTMAPDLPAATAAIAAARPAGQLVQDAALAVIAAYNIPITTSRPAATPEDAADAAAAIGFPVVLKLSHPDMPTNRIAGSIALDLPDAAAVRAAGHAILTRLQQRGQLLAGATFLVQKQAPRGTQLRIHVADNPTLGPLIGLGAGGGDPDDLSGLAIELPPLNLALAQALIARSPAAPQLAAHRGAAAADLPAIAATLVRISQLIIDTPEILSLDLDPLFAFESGVIAASARITLRPAGTARPPLVISPYPADLTSHYEAKGQKFLLRPIRPEDADAHAALFARFPPEDMRFRFFSAVRQMPVEQIIRMTDIDYAREMAIVAIQEENGQTAGAARLVRNDTDGLSAEFAIGIDPAAKGTGLAAALMRAIIAWGKSQNVQEITGTILSDNTPMLIFIRKLGFSIHHIPGEADIVEAKLTP